MARSSPRTEVLPDRASWLARRAKGIGASEAAAILGAHPYSTALTVYARKAGLAPEPEQNDYMEAGHRLEPVVSDWYSDRTGHVVTDPGDFTIWPHATCPFMYATLDRVVPGSTRARDGALELKTTSVWNKDAWKDGAPLHVQIQLQHQLACSGHRWGQIAVLIGGQSLFITEQITRNEVFIARMEAKLATFWQMLQDGVMPEPTSIDGDVLAAIYPESNGEIVPLYDLDEVDSLLVDTREKIKALQVVESDCENRIKAAIQDNEVGVLEGAIYEYRTVRRKAYAVKATEYRRLKRKAVK